jgi:hypothetical protein
MWSERYSRRPRRSCLLSKSTCVIPALIPGETKMKSMQCAFGRVEVLGVKRRRALPGEGVGQAGLRQETAQQSAVAVDVEVPAHHGRSGRAYDPRHDAELALVQREEPVCLRPVTIPVSHRMRIHHAYPWIRKLRDQNPLQPRSGPDRPGHARRLRREAKAAVGAGGYRQPGEHHQPAGRPGRRWPVGHVAERTHPPGQHSQVPVGEYLLESDHICARSIESLTDCPVPRRQLRPSDRHSPRVEGRDSQPGITLRPAGIGAIRVVPIPPVLVRMLRRHLDEYGSTPDGRPFRGARGGVLSESVYGRTWHAARQAALGPDLAATALARRPYDLRRAALALWLNASGEPAEVAARADSSARVLHDTYLHGIDGHQDLVSQRIEDALDAGPGGRRRHSA